MDTGLPQLLIRIPFKFLHERSYIIQIFFTQLLGLSYRLEQVSHDDYEIILPSGNRIVIEDHFFSRFCDGLMYLSSANLPADICHSENQFLTESNIPVIFGYPGVQITEENIITILCRIDIFSASFFMLSRWEEYVVSDRDEFNRFPDKSSVSARFGFQHRPVVNEYAEMLWKMLLYLGFASERKKRSFEAIVTHDVDEIIRYKNPARLMKILAGDLVKRKKPGLMYENIVNYFRFKQGIKHDSYDTFEFLMRESERINVKSVFFFLAEFSKTNRGGDFRYSLSNPMVLNAINLVKQRGHQIGIHGSFNSYNNIQLLSGEIANLENISGEISWCRQHYLRFSSPETWKIQNLNNIKFDSTLGFSSDFGFRCGICTSFPVFDFIERKSLHLTEYPLIAMDSALAELRTPEEFFSRICLSIDIVRKFNGKFVFFMA